MIDYEANRTRVQRLIRPEVHKKRTCLSCGKAFLSKNNAHRICATCKVNKSHYGIMASKTVGMYFNRVKTPKDNE